MEKIYSTKEIAEKLGYAHITLQKWCLQNKVRKIGRDYLMSDADVEAFKNRGNGRESKTNSV